LIRAYRFVSAHGFRLHRVALRIAGVASKEFSMPSIRSPCWIRCCRKRCDAATINRHQHPKRKQFWTAADRALTAGIVIGLEDAITDKAQPPGLMESYRPSVRLLSSNKTGSPKPVAEQTREVFFDQSMVCARHAARRIDL
jgi:hypothetical protein